MNHSNENEHHAPLGDSTYKATCSHDEMKIQQSELLENNTHFERIHVNHPHEQTSDTIAKTHVWKIIGSKNTSSKERHVTVQSCINVGEFKITYLITLVDPNTLALTQLVLQFYKDRGTKNDVNDLISYANELYINYALNEVKTTHPEQLSHVSVSVPVKDQHGNKGMIAEYFKDGTCEDFLSKNLTNEEKLDFAKQMCQATRQLHQLGIIHRDIKLDNFLVHEEGGKRQIKLTDFGSSILQSNKLSTNKAIFAFAPPEAVYHHSDKTEAGDIYRLGITFYQLYSGKNLNEIIRDQATCQKECENLFLQEGKTIDDAKTSACLLSIQDPHHIQLSLVQDLKMQNLVGRMISKNPHDRPTLEEIINELSTFETSCNT